MDGTESETSDTSRDSLAEPHETDDEAHAKADRAAKGLRDQIAALRQQVRDAQETLRDHERRRETRTFKR